MTVTGTEQRVYGTLVGGCIIDLHRFALVLGSQTAAPISSGLTFSQEFAAPGDELTFDLYTDDTAISTPTVSLTGPSTIYATDVTYESFTVIYADETPYKQCGYKYDGYLTLFLSISGASVYAAVEVYICKNDNKRIVLETYGEVAKTVTGGMALWFNKGVDKHYATRGDFPETGSENVNYINDQYDDWYIWNGSAYYIGSCWVKLNSTTSDVKMPYAKTSYTFKETKRNGSITIDCCKKCPSCGCKACSVQFYVMLRGTSTKIYPTSTLMYGYHDPPYGNQSCLWKISTVPVMTVADWRCLEVDVNVPDNVIYDVYFEDPDGDDPLIGSFEWFRSDSNYEIVVEYTLECDDIKVWAYTEVDDDNWQLSNLVGRPIRIMDGTGHTNSGTIASISGTSGVVTISVPDIQVAYIYIQSGSYIPSTDLTPFTAPNLPTSVMDSGWCSVQNFQTVRFIFNGKLQLQKYGVYGGTILTTLGIAVTGSGYTIALGTLIANMPTFFTGRWIEDDPTTGMVGTVYMIANGEYIDYTYPYYKSSGYDPSNPPLAYGKFRLSTNEMIRYRPSTGDLLTVTMEIISPSNFNVDRCVCRMEIGERVYID